MNAPTAITRTNGFPGRSADKGNGMKVVVRWIPVLGRWYICHAATYQNAYRKESNGYATRTLAIQFARQQGCEVEFHERDQLQYH